MALSNTAVPRYYGQFRDAVLRGEIAVNQKISLEMNRIDALIANPAIWYDPDPTEGYIRYCEGELTLTNGEPLILLPTFKLWAEQIYGWYYFEERSVFVPDDSHHGHYEKRLVKKRLTNEQYLIVGRGNSKTLYDSTIQSYEQNINTETTHGIATAPTMRQAEEMLSPLRTAISISRGPLFRFLTMGSINNTTGSKAKRVKLASTKKGIENFITGSDIEVWPMLIDKLQGLRCKVATVDEWLSCDIRENPINAIKQGASKVADFIIVATSSEGTVRNGAGDGIKMDLDAILNGEYVNPHVSIFWYKLDDIKEIPFPETWVKANPNIGITVDYDVIQQDVEKAEHSPSSRNDIIAKRFGIPCEGYTYFFTYDETKPHRKQEYWGMPCALGADLSQGDDFCAFTFMFPLPNEYFGIKTRSYISELTFQKLPPILRSKYEQFIEEGTLIIMNGSILNMMDVYDDLDDHIISRDYDVRCFGYDPYNAGPFVERYCKENGAYGVEKVIQGIKTESVPLGELKKLSEDGRLLFDEELMSFTMGNCIALEDNNGNRKLLKRRREEKIDNVAAMMDAFIAFKNNHEAFE